MSNEKITVPRELIVECLRRLETIVPSLSRLGSLYHDVPREEYNAAMAEFMREWAVGRHLGYVRARLSELLPYDELEQFLEGTPTWRVSHRKPPPGFDGGPGPDDPAWYYIPRVKPKSPRRIGVAGADRPRELPQAFVKGEGEFVLFDQTLPAGKEAPAVTHSHVRTWDQLTEEMKQTMIGEYHEPRSTKGHEDLYLVISHEPVEPIARDEAQRKLALSSASERCRALVSLAFHDRDWRWVQDECLRLLEDRDVAVRQLAATCLGHVARIHRQLDLDRVESILQRLRSDPDLGGVVSDALDDVDIFIRQRR